MVFFTHTHTHIHTHIHSEGVFPQPEVATKPLNSLMDQLDTGDIVLLSGATSSGAIIKLFDQSQFSHVGIVSSGACISKRGIKIRYSTTNVYSVFSILFAQSSACDKNGIFYLYCVCSILYVVHVDASCQRFIQVLKTSFASQLLIWEASTNKAGGFYVGSHV